MSKTRGALIFVLGVAVGSATSWSYVKKKYEQIAQEEIDSVKQTYADREDRVMDKQLTNTQDERNEMTIPKKPPIADYASMINKAGYTNYNDPSTLEDDGFETIDRPYVIHPDEFGELDEYEQITLLYYEDGVLTDDMNEPVEEVDELVGFESFKHFGEHEEDVVYVRNDQMCADYEILRENRRYEDLADDGN